MNSHTSEMRQYREMAKAKLIRVLDEICANCPQKLEWSDRVTARNYIDDLCSDLFSLPMLAASKMDDEEQYPAIVEQREHERIERAFVRRF